MLQELYGSLGKQFQHLWIKLPLIKSRLQNQILKKQCGKFVTNLKFKRNMEVLKRIELNIGH